MMTNQRILRTISALMAALTITFLGQSLPDMSPQPASASPTYNIQYDLDGNGRIDVQDIMMVSSAWGTVSRGVPDLDGNGLIDIRDIMLVASRWGSSKENVSSGKKGVGVPSWDQGYWKNVSDAQIKDTKSQWFYDWGVHAKFFDYSTEYVPMIWSERLDWYGGASRVAALAAANPGRYWLIWNEPDLAGQANITPDRGAQLYHQMEELILGADPTAKLIIGGVSQLGWPQWPEQFLAAYKTLYGKEPTHVGWHLHFYPGDEVNTDPDGAAKHTQEYVQNARAWVDNNGGGELWLTEFGVGSTDKAAQAYMSRIVPWLQNYKGVNRFAWFAIDTTYIGWTAGSLMDRNFNLTELGKLYASY